jgi:beta-galactosidase
VDDGGTLAVWYFTGIADPENRIRLGGYGAALTEVLGVRVEELHPVPAGSVLGLSTGARARIWSELVRAESASVVAEYADGVLSGHPAITQNRYGTGQAWYVSTDLIDDDLDGFIRDLIAAAGVRPVVPGAGAGVEVVRRHEAKATWVVAINHTDQPVDLAVHGHDLRTGEAVGGQLRLAPGDFSIVLEAQAGVERA